MNPQEFRRLVLGHELTGRPAPDAPPAQQVQPKPAEPAVAQAAAQAEAQPRT